MWGGFVFDLVIIFKNNSPENVNIEKKITRAGRHQFEIYSVSEVYASPFQADEPCSPEECDVQKLSAMNWARELTYCRRRGKSYIIP